MKRFLFFAMFIVWALPAMALVQPDEVLADPLLEGRARVLGTELRCLVCQGQSIEDSDAELAGDLRRLVRTRLLAGDSDQQVLDFIRVRYGDYVLLRPPVQKNTYLLWVLPGIFLAVGCGIVVLMTSLRSKRS